MSTKVFSHPPIMTDDEEEEEATVYTKNSESEQEESEQEEEVVAEVVTPVVPQRKTSKARTIKDTSKLSANDRRLIQKNSVALMKTFMTDTTKRFDILMSDLSAGVMSINKPAPKPKVSKKIPLVTYKLENIHTSFVSKYLSSYSKDVITSKDLISTFQIYATSNDVVNRNSATLDSLNFTTIEKKILSKIKSDDHPLNISKQDYKVLVSKLVKPVTTFNYDGVEYEINSTLWDKLLKNKKIANGSHFDDKSLNICPPGLAARLKECFKKPAPFAGKVVTEESFNAFMNSVTKKSTNLFFPVASANSPILEFLKVPFVEIDSILYTKASLLSAAFSAKIDPSTKRFDAETESVISSVFFSTDLAKVKVDELVNRCSYTMTV